MSLTSVGIYEFNAKDLIGHGAFAVVYKGRLKTVSQLFIFKFKQLDCTIIIYVMISDDIGKLISTQKFIYALFMFTNPPRLLIILWGMRHW